MSRISPRPRQQKPLHDSAEWVATIAHHDAELRSLGGRMSGVETGLTTLQSEVAHGFTEAAQRMSQEIGGLSSKLDKLDAAPKFDVHKTVSTVVSLAVLFSMICGGIIWITTSQFSGMVAEQRGFNSAISSRIDRAEASLSEIKKSVGQWDTTTHGMKR